jgi:chromosome segregation ATPase
MVEVTYTPEKLYENFIFREVNSTKRLEEERKRARLYEAENKLHLEKISQQETEIATITRTLNEQIDMYKKLIRDLELEKKNHILRIQEQFRIEIEAILANHEEVSKVEQAKQEEFEARIEELEAQLEAHRSDIKGHEGNISGLSLRVSTLEAELKHSRDLLAKAEAAHLKSAEQYRSEIENLNRSHAGEKANLKSHFEAVLADRQKEIDNVHRMGKLEQDKLENKRQTDISNKNSELREQRAAFEAEKSGLQQLLDAKESAHARLAQELGREKDRFARTVEHLETQLDELGHINESLKKELLMLGDANNALQMDRGISDKDNSALADEIRRLREVLMESSIEMDKFREEFVRMDAERDRARRQLAELDKELARTKELLIEKDQESRNWMENYFALKARF